MSEQRLQEFWGRFVVETGVNGEHTAFGFGSDAEMATELGLLVRDGPKRATASLRSWYEQDGEPMPQPGDLSVVLDGHGDPLCDPHHDRRGAAVRRRGRGVRLGGGGGRPQSRPLANRPPKRPRWR